MKLFLIIIVANNRIFLSIIENKQQETIFANFLSHFVDYRSANLRIIIALGMSVCSVIIQAQWGKVVLKSISYIQTISQDISFTLNLWFYEKFKKYPVKPQCYGKRTIDAWFFMAKIIPQTQKYIPSEFLCFLGENSWLFVKAWTRDKQGGHRRTKW